MKNNKKIAIIVIVNIIIIGIICSFINIKANVVKEKQIIKEMSESTQVSNLQTQIITLNKEHTDYANYIQTSKREIANAITEMGVETSENADAVTMASNIRSLSGIIKTNSEIMTNGIFTDKTVSNEWNVSIDRSHVSYGTYSTNFTNKAYISVSMTGTSPNITGHLTSDKFCVSGMSHICVNVCDFYDIASTQNGSSSSDIRILNSDGKLIYNKTVTKKGNYYFDVSDYEYIKIQLKVFSHYTRTRGIGINSIKGYKN